MSNPDTLLEGKYEILNKIHEGGMGTIYRVRHRLLDEVRVIKVMRAHAIADADLKRRFFDEAKTATRLKHQNICTILDFALDEEGTAYLVMEFIEGVNLSELLGLKGPPGIPLSLEIAHQTLLALGYLHRKNVIHRDVAPDNLMLSRTEEGRPLVKVVDLGIAKATDRPTEMTATGVFLGKLRYASPEQFGALGSAERLDGRSDLYSLGVVLYELLTGVRPFAGESPPELLRGHLFNPPQPFSQSDPEGRIPADLRAAILKALEKKREDRFGSAEEFDREILSLRQRLGRHDDVESTRALLSTIPSLLRESRGPVTPSAQSRLNQQFVASTTPPPSTPHLTVAPTVSAVPPGAPAPRSREGRRSRLLLPLAILLSAGVTAAILLHRRAPSSPRAETRDASVRATAVRVASPEVRAEPTLPHPSPAPTLEPTEPPAPTLPPRVAAPAAPPPRRAADARRPVKPTEVALRGVVAAPTSEAMPTPPPARVVPTRPAAPAPESEPVASEPSVSVRSGVSDQDRIREAIHRYETAQSTLDADLYARVFPTVDRARIERAFQSLASQSVQFEVRRIQIDPSGAQARVDGYERRTAMPRAGTEQRASGDRILHLEKRAEGWVIVALN